MRVAWLSVVLAGLCMGCAVDPFACQSSSQCVEGGVDGVCQANGNCSFPDEECASGQRYGQFSNGGIGGQCVPPEDAAGSTGGSASGSATSTTTRGSAGSESSTGMTTLSTSSTSSTGSTSTTGVGPTGGTTDSGSTGSVSTSCPQYCAAKEACNLSSPDCIDACEESVADAYEDDGGCGSAVESLVQCRTQLECLDLEAAIETGGLDESCSIQNEAVYESCSDEDCAAYCSLADMCMMTPPPGGGAQEPECVVGCTLGSRLAGLDVGGADCLDAYETFVECLGMLMTCEELDAALMMSGACVNAFGQVFMTCPMLD